MNKRELERRIIDLEVGLEFLHKTLREQVDGSSSNPTTLKARIDALAEAVGVDFKIRPYSSAVLKAVPTAQRDVDMGKEKRPVGRPKGSKNK